MRPLQKITSAFLLLAVIVIQGCAVIPHDLDNDDADSKDFFVRKVISSNIHRSSFDGLKQMNISINDAADLSAVTISRGDWLKIKVLAMPSMDGVYQVNAIGDVELPFGASLRLAGLSRAEANDRFRTQLKDLGWFNGLSTDVDVSLVRYSSIDVSVFGAVFNSGQVTINSTPAKKQQDGILQTAGTFSSDRNLISAIVAAGGVRPDADLDHITLRRDTQLYSIDLSKLIHGSGFSSIPTLIQGDEVFIASKGVESTSLIRPTQITPPGMRVLMSNLTAPALNNALSAVGAEATRLPYGSSLMDAAISANCVGGTHQANASRSIVLITRHYGSTEQVAIRRSINQLLANTSDYAVNPFLMPNDGVACYDSRFTNIRDVARGIGELFGPILIGGLL